ncbi:MAG: hypothetical protein AAFN11_07640, partial [Chloroflexota bacterium]
MARPTLQIQIHSTDDNVIKFCERYWKWDEETESFVGRVRDIASELGGKTTREFIQYIQNNSTAYTEETSCQHCGKFYTFTSRSDYIQHRGIDNWVCKSCRADIRRENAKQEAILEERRREAKKLQQSQRRSILLNYFDLENRPQLDIIQLTLVDVVGLLS